MALCRYRKGLGHILETFDEARPRGDKTINSVKAIYKALHLDEIYARMREEDKGVSVFEVLVAHAFKSPDDAGAAGGGGGAAPAATPAGDVVALESKVSDLEAQLRTATEEREHAERSLATLKQKFVVQKKELDQTREQLSDARKGGWTVMAGVRVLRHTAAWLATWVDMCSAQ